MNIKYWLICIAAPILLICGCSAPKETIPNLADNIENVSANDNLHYTCEYMGIQREYTLYLPDNPSGSTLVIMLHGYGGSADSFARDTKLHETLVPAGYTVAYVEGITDPDDQTSSSGWNSGLKSTGNDDAGFLSSLARYLQREYLLESSRCVAVGFSNGAFMTHRLAIDSSGVFTDIVSVAGMMPEFAWAMKPEAAPVSVLQISGTKDDVVPQKRNKTDRYAKAPAIEDVMDYYALSSDLTKGEAYELSEQSNITEYGSLSNDNVVWEVSVEDGRHSWYEETYCGFKINDLILDFLQR